VGEANLVMSGSRVLEIRLAPEDATEDEVVCLCNDWFTLQADLAWMKSDRDEARDALQAPLLARNQPCGCVTCVCDGQEQCFGCGAKRCTGADCVFKTTTRERVVYDSAPSYAQLRAERDTALAQRDRLMAVLQDEQFSRVEMDRVIATVMTPEAAKEGE
jgi:hypothetical protein